MRGTLAMRRRGVNVVATPRAKSLILSLDMCLADAPIPKDNKYII
jgi:hypothetical protein